MPVENDRDNIQTEPSGKTAGTPFTPADPLAKPNESTTGELEKDIQRGERWLIRIGIATLLINTIIALIYVRQLQAMRDANDLTRAALKTAAQDSLDSSRQFQVQLQHFDAEVGQTEMLVKHTEEQAKASQDAATATIGSYEATARPYIGVVMSSTRHNDPDSLKFNAVFKNYGTVPSEQTVLAWRVVFDGHEVPSLNKLPDSPSMMFPTETAVLPGDVAGVDATSLLQGKKKLTVYTTDAYRWRGKNQRDCEKFEYAPTVGAFFNLGPVCYPH